MVNYGASNGLSNSFAINFIPGSFLSRELSGHSSCMVKSLV